MKKCYDLLCFAQRRWKKTIRAMKLTIALMLFAVLVSTAGSTYSQNVRINLKMTDASLVDVFREIERSSEFGFFFKNEELDMNKRVSIDLKNATIDDILKNILIDNYSYRIIDKNIIVTRANANSTEQQKPVTGKVTDDTGSPIPGVSVIMKGTTSGTITDGDGNFSLSNIPENQVLLFSFIGMKPQEVAVEGKTTINIVMEVETYGVDEVVVTALGIGRETKSLGYATQQVAGKGLQTVKGIDIGTSLTGRVAGVMVKNSTEFSAEPEIYIRGESNPLLVIDGVPYQNMSLRDIPSDDIDNISVLKGATASALYGSRGQTGAIMITTKKGSETKGVSVSINSGTMFSAGFLAIPEMQSTYGRAVTTGTNTYVGSGNGPWGPPLEGQEVIQWDPISKTMKAMPYLPIGKDNFKNYLEQGYILNNNVSVVQQGEHGSLRASATWVQNKGQYPNSKFDKLTYTLGGDMKMNKFTLSSSMTFNKQSSPNVGFSGYTGYDPMYNILIWSAPDYDIRDYKDYWVIKNEVQNNSYTSVNNNPYFDRYERIHSLNRDIFNGTLALNYDILPGLKATFRTGFDTYSDRQEIRISMGSFTTAGNGKVIKNGSEVWGESKKGSYNTGLGRGYSINNDLLLSGNKKIGNFTLDGLVGGTIFYIQDEGIEAKTQSGLLVPGYYSLASSVNPAKVSSSLQKKQVNSLFGRLAVSWKNMVYVEGTYRNDWSSTLSAANRSYQYPSVSGSFIASELLPEMNWLSLWKLRGSWTTARNVPGIYDINSVYSTESGAKSWGTLNKAIYPTTIRLMDLTADGSETIEIGTALNVMKNRASLDVSYYTKRFYDVLVATGVSPTSGFLRNYINSKEEITRRGLEVVANVTPVKSNDWKWDVTINWSTYARYYTKLDPEFSADKPWVKVGERADAFVLNEYQKDPDGNIIHSNGKPLYSAYQSKFGNQDPDWIWGANSTLRYKDFQLNVSVDGRVGGLAQTTTEMYMWRAGSHPNSVVPERYLDATVGGSNYIGQGVMVTSGAAAYDTYGNITSDTRVYAENDVPVTYKSYLEALHRGTAWGGVPSSVDAYSTTFFKIREMSLSYDLPKNICSKFNAKSASISAVGQNVFLWAKEFKYSDPDGGSENFSDPSQRYLGLNLKFNF